VLDEMPPEKLISLEFTARECALIGSLLRRSAREFVLLPVTGETTRKLALRFALVTEIPSAVQVVEAEHLRNRAR
jgi:hypothetical protein